ncbi:SGNH/GDSL hydrolase family protein [Winogradskyella aurantia]|uniref:Lysophospholipase n=1 Tax=Winogradskyella aurantia TaxID=1915063 RepID=A0A265UZ29_9FLAO|nr:SGNH/GDSL hydrolase family protein [Winogradskyella aurantia]OZV70556.1 lysophospholipase [Winogradskyella aurantia]
MRKITYLLLICLLTIGCEPSDNTIEPLPKTFNILSLGDSYTVGAAVCNTCKFPEQLKDSLKGSLSQKDSINLSIIAQTGWTTTNLIGAIENQNPSEDFDMVTLLIGVNNQFLSRPFTLYENEFPILTQTAVTKAQGDRSRVIVLSIPDYAYTPFGQNNGNPEVTSQEINEYNAFAQNYCLEENITFLNITDITQEGLNNPDLVAPDGLHPSELAYSKFMERLLPIVVQKLEL